MHRHALHVLLLTVFLLTGLGMVMLSSTGAFALESRGDMYFFLKRQALWLAIALAAGTLAAVVDYDYLRRYWAALFALAFVLLLLCFAPGVGLRINGSNRWIHLGLATFQPSELAKIAAIVFLAWYYDKYPPSPREFWRSFALPLGAVGVLVVPILLEVDLGTSALIMAVAICVMFLAGAGLRWLAPLALAVPAAILYIATHMDERMGRLLAFLNPEKYKLGEGLQQWNALIAFGSGGVEGLGLGAGRQKMLYLPYAHTDFIFPMIGEELGLKFTLATVAGFLVICLCGCAIALSARERFGMILGFGCVMTITLQAAVNIGVTTSLLPNKGMPLPFISFGGSSLLASYVMVGLLAGICLRGLAPVRAAEPVLRHTQTFCRL